MTSADSSLAYLCPQLPSVPPTSPVLESVSGTDGRKVTDKIAESIRQEILRCGLQARVHSYTADATVFSQGIKADAVYFIEEGTVKVTRGESDGRLLIIGLRKRGQILGLPSVLLDQPYTTGAFALTRCVLHVVPASDFLSAIHESSELAWHVLQLQSRKVCERLEKIVWFGALTARDRLVRFLSELASTRGTPEWSGDVKIPATLKFWEIAQAIGVTPPYLTRLFNELERENLIRRDKGWVILRQPEKGGTVQETKRFAVDRRLSKPQR